MSLRAKLLAGLGPLLVAMLVTVVVGSRTTTELGHSSQRILNENYRSVIATEHMKEALEQIDRGLSSLAAGQADSTLPAVQATRRRFAAELIIESQNITEPGEGDAAEHLQNLWRDYENQVDLFTRQSAGPIRRSFYFDTLSPAFLEVERAVDVILDMNQRAMLEKSAHAEREAGRWNRIVIAVGVTGSLLAVSLSTTWLSRLLRPLRVLGSASRRIGLGDLAVRAVVHGHDEVALLARDFNDMAERLQQYRRSSLGQLLQAQQNLQATLDSMPDPIVVVDVDGALAQANRAAESILRVPPSAPGSAWTTRLSPALRAAIDRTRTHVLSGKGPFIPQGLEEAVVVESSDGPKQFMARAQPTYDEDGTVTGTTILLQDVTRIVRLDELRSNLVATVAHEFRTPLTSIRMAIHLCAEGIVGPLTDKQADLLTTAREECERLQIIVDDLLSTSRMQNGNLLPHRTLASAEDLIESATHALRPAAEARGLDLRMQAIPGLGHVSVDRDQMNMLWSNLVMNALQHSPKGGQVTIGGRRLAREIEFDVRDQGPGIAHKYQSAVFEPRFQAPGGHPGAAGLGLAIAKRIVDQHEGHIGVESEAGAGARFWFRLPLADESIQRS